MQRCCNTEEISIIKIKKKRKVKEPHSSTALLDSCNADGMEVSYGEGKTIIEYKCIEPAGWLSQMELIRKRKEMYCTY